MAVIPAKAGIQCPKSLTIVPIRSRYDFWTPAFAGVTDVWLQVCNSYPDSDDDLANALRMKAGRLTMLDCTIRNIQDGAVSR